MGIWVKLFKLKFYAKVSSSKKIMLPTFSRIAFSRQPRDKNFLFFLLFSLSNKFQLNPTNDSELIHWKLITKFRSSYSIAYRLFSIFFSSSLHYVEIFRIFFDQALNVNEFINSIGHAIVEKLERQKITFSNSIYTRKIFLFDAFSSTWPNFSAL